MGKHILLVEPNYYSRYPPIGLLKLSAYHKQKGDTTELVKGLKNPGKKPNIIYVTSLFTWAWKPVWDAVKFYKNLFPKVEVWLGGLYASLLPSHAAQSRADYIHVGTYKEAEDLLPDYSLVPNWDGSVIFSSRGCIRSCPFCAVPILEGKLNSVKPSIKHLIWPTHTKVIFFDNNLLANPKWKDIFQELRELNLKVDFNQGLDARLITEKVAQELSTLKKERLIRLAYDNKKMKKSVKKAIELLKAHGIRGRNIMVYALYNYHDEGPQEFFERVRDILEWEAVAYPMRYIPIDALDKNSYVAPGWDPIRLEMVQKARRVLGYGGAFPPYTGLVQKFQKANTFDEAFSLRPLKRKD